MINHRVRFVLRSCDKAGHWLPVGIYRNCHGLSTNVSKNKELQDILREGATEVSHLLSVVSTMLTWTEAMKRRDRKLADLRLVMEHCLEDDRAAKHAIQMQLTRQIIGPPPSWPSLGAVVSSICVISDRATNEKLMPYCSMVQWEGLQFEFKLNPCCRMLAIAPPGIDFLSNDNISTVKRQHFKVGGAVVHQTRQGSVCNAF